MVHSACKFERRLTVSGVKALSTSSARVGTARHLETTAISIPNRALASPDRAGACGRITPRQTFLCFELTTGRDAPALPDRRTRGWGGLGRFGHKNRLPLTQRESSVRYSCPPAPKRRKCWRRTTGAPEAVTARWRSNRVGMCRTATKAPGSGSCPICQSSSLGPGWRRPNASPSS